MWGCTIYNLLYIVQSISYKYCALLKCPYIWSVMSTWFIPQSLPLRKSLIVLRLSSWNWNPVILHSIANCCTTLCNVTGFSLKNSFHLQLFFIHSRISYPIIQIATQSGKSVYLTVIKDTSDSVVLLFKLISNRAASGLYRAITETHAFYRWGDRRGSTCGEPKHSHAVQLCSALHI